MKSTTYADKTTGAISINNLLDIENIGFFSIPFHKEDAQPDFTMRHDFTSNFFRDFISKNVDYLDCAVQYPMKSTTCTI